MKLIRRCTSALETLPYFTALLVVLIAVEYAVTQSSWYINSSWLPLTIFIDIVVGVPLLYYLLMVRTKKMPSYTMGLVSGGTLLLVATILPSASTHYFEYLYYIAPIVEVFIVLFVVYKLRTMIQTYKKLKPSYYYFSDAVEATLVKTFSKMFGLGYVVSEFVLTYYALFGWFKQYTNHTVQSFSYHKTNSYTGMFIAFCVVLLIETVAMHFIIGLWSNVVAWVVTALSVYTLVWILGDFNAIRLQPIVVDDTHLYLRLGLRYKAKIPLETILSVRQESKTSDLLELEKPQEIDTAFRLVLINETNILITLSQHVRLYGLFGRQKLSDEIAFYVDEPQRFMQALKVGTYA